MVNNFSVKYMEEQHADFSHLRLCQAAMRDECGPNCYNALAWLDWVLERTD